MAITAPKIATFSPTGTFNDHSILVNGFFIGLIVVFVAFAVLMAVWGRLRRQVGGGYGPTEFSDGSMTTTPTGYPEEMKGDGKKISPTDNNAAPM